LAGEDADMGEPFEELVVDSAEIFEGAEELEDDIEVKVDEEPEEFEESEEQARTPKTRRSPKAPTKAEREAHDATHLPYRAWCHHCVRGRGAKKPHRRQTTDDKENEDMKVPRILMNYHFMSTKDEQNGKNPVLNMKDESTGNRYMRAVGKKGVGITDGNDMEWLIKDLSEELKSWGHPGGVNGNIVMKTDGEPAVVALREAVARYHGGVVTPEQPPPGESQAMGAEEESGKTMRGMVKVYKDQLEEKAKMQLEPTSVILLWMIRWAAMAYSRFKIGDDGKTAYERQKGRKCKLEVVPFGEKVFYKKLNQTASAMKSLESTWREGVWLGHARGSSEALIGTDDGVVRAWTVKRMIEEERWSAEAIRNMKGTPSQPNPLKPGLSVPIAVNVENENAEAELDELAGRREEMNARRTYPKARDFEAHGYTNGCEGCRRQQAGGMKPRGHNDKCRERMEKLLKDEQNPRWARANEARMENPEKRDIEQPKRRGRPCKKTAEVETDKFDDEKEEAEHKDAGVEASASSGFPPADAGVEASASSGLSPVGEVQDQVQNREKRKAEHEDETIATRMKRPEETGIKRKMMKKGNMEKESRGRKLRKKRRWKQMETEKFED
jgi:hypothetical protein